MTVATLPMPGATWSSTSLPTSAITDYALKLTAGLVFPFDRFVEGLANDLTMQSRATSSAIEQDRFERPMLALYEALAEAHEVAAVSEDHMMPSVPTLREARKLLRMLPRDVAMPEPVIEPSGTIAWSWDHAGVGYVVLAVNGTGAVQRSAVIGGTLMHGRSAMSDRLAPDDLALVARFRLAHG